MKNEAKKDWTKTRKKACPPAQFTETEDDTIRDVYGKKIHPIKFLFNSTMLGQKYTKAQLKYRATTIGVSRKPDRFPFCNREVELMEKSIGEKSVPEMLEMLHRAGFKHRTVKHIRAFIYRRGGGSVRSDRYSSRELCSFFRCTTTQLRRWEKDKILVPSGQYENNGKCFYKPLEVARFIRHHSFELENYRVDVPWMVSLFEELWSKIKDLPEKKKGNGNGYGIKQEDEFF
jgi:hypothetical protein